MTAKTEKPTGLALLRMPFPPNCISKLPKETKAQKEAREKDRNLMVWKCPECGGAHHKNAVHLNYVGHAALTDRLLDCDPNWSWEPCVAPGLPNPGNGMWITLTVCGVSRIGYGSADGKNGGDAIKEIIGDALRNAAMRFGAALDLWHKGDLHADDDARQPASDTPEPVTPVAEGQGKEPFPPGPCKNISNLKSMARDIWRQIEGCGDQDQLDAYLADKDVKAVLKQAAELTGAWGTVYYGDGGDNPGLQGLISRKSRELGLNDFIPDRNMLAAG